MDEAHCLSAHLVVSKLLRPDKFDHRQMLQGGLQILTESEEIASGLT